MTWAEFREAQYLTTRALPKVGLAVITDVGDQNDVHPERASNRSASGWQSPAWPSRTDKKWNPAARCTRLIVEGDQAVLTFDHLGGGLVCQGREADRLLHRR